jgi:O-antigen ligase
MFDKWLKLPAHYYLKITALVILTVGVSLHNTLMSIGSIWIISNWLIEAKFKEYWKYFKTTPSIWMLMGILALSFISLLWTEDTAYGLKDIARKLPFFVIPFALGTSQRIEQKVVIFLLYIFIGVLVLTTGINYYRFHYYLGDLADIREMSYFISHVRLAILVVLGIFISVYLIAKKKGPWWLWILTAAWLLFYLFKSQTLNGYVLLTILIICSWIFLIAKLKMKRMKIIALSGLLGIISIGVFLLVSAANSYKEAESVDFANLDELTVGGRPYLHDTVSTMMENGHLVWLYVQEWEMAHEWNKRSDIHYYMYDKKGQPMYGTVMRYLTSKNVRKDSAGIWSLTDEEVQLIENGCASVNMNTGFKGKMHEFLFQYNNYKNGGDPNGQSILQRLEHIRVAWYLIKQNGFLGVGIGDMPMAFDEAYTETNSLLAPEHRHRAHNQFLSMWISLGIIGLLLFVGFMLIPFYCGKSKDYLFLMVMITLLVSCMFQDMLETQAGVTIFGLFYSLIVYREVSSINSSVKEGSRSS